MKKIAYSLLTLSLLLLTNCRDEFQNDLAKQSVDHGQADFTTYVALGNSLTAGYQSGALLKSGQENSYPAILAKQMEQAGRKGAFNQPLMSDDLGGLIIKKDTLETGDTYAANSKISSRKYVLVEENGQLIPEPLPGLAGTIVDSSYSLYDAQGPFCNMGVPAAKSYQLNRPEFGKFDSIGFFAGFSSPYFVRMASSDTATVLGDALKQKPSFFSLWIGSNDVLLYALAGGTNTQFDVVPATDQTGNPDFTSHRMNDITDPGLFATSFEGLVKALTDQGAKGVVANIPYVTSIPYFTTAKWNDCKVDAAQLKNWTPFITAFNKVLDGLDKAGTIKDAALRKLQYTASHHNPFLIVDVDLKKDIASDLMPLKPLLTAQGIEEADANKLLTSLGRARPAHEGDFILLSALKALRKEEVGSELGIVKPLVNELVLTQTEAEKVSTATAAYNQTIQAMANEYGLAFVDAAAKLHELSHKGIQFNGNRYNAVFVKGGAFSLDGIHPNSRGYAIVANTFIEVINKQYGSKLPQVDPNAYPGITYP